MKHRRLTQSAFWWGSAAALAMLVYVVGGATVAAGAAAQNTSGPDLSIGPAQYPDDDAIFLRWEQHWALDKDGTAHRRVHYWVKLLNSRPIRRLGDPRIDFKNGHDELIFHKAQSVLPNGTILPVPDYSFNRVGPDDVAGWPEYADWQQMVVSFSGIEEGAVLEMDYEIVTPAGVLPWIEGDIRLHDEYPIVQRIVSVTLPDSTRLRYQVDRADGPARPDTQPADNGLTNYRWVFENLPADRDEAQSPPWFQRSSRLRFTTCPDPARWARTLIERVDRAARSDDAIHKFAQDTIEEETDPAEHIRKIAKKLHDSFNFIDSPKALRALTCRPAADVFKANYGNSLESAALCAAALRALGLNVSLAAGVEADRWSESDKVAPMVSAFSGAVVVVDLPDGPVYVHPQHGVVDDPSNWGRRVLLTLDDSGKLGTKYLPARGEQVPSDLQITGKIVIDAEGKATGELRLSLTGLFYDPAALETADAQKSLVTGLVGRVLTGFDVPGHSVVRLSGDLFKATAGVSTADALKSYEKRQVLRLGDGPAFLGEVPMPLSRSYRRTDVRLNGRFHEQVDLTIELPEGWKPAILPSVFPLLAASWGQIAQQIDVDGQTVRFRRTIEITRETIPSADFARIREAINTLRADRSLLLTAGK